MASRHLENCIPIHQAHSRCFGESQSPGSGLISYIQYVPNGCVYFTSAYLQEYVAKCTYRAKPVEKKATYRNVRNGKAQHL